MSAEKITRINDGLNVPNEPIIPFIVVMVLDQIFGKQRVALLMQLLKKHITAKNVLNGKKY